MNLENEILDEMGKQLIDVIKSQIPDAFEDTELQEEFEVSPVTLEEISDDILAVVYNDMDDDERLVLFNKLLFIFTDAEQYTQQSSVDDIEELLDCVQDCYSEDPAELSDAIIVLKDIYNSLFVSTHSLTSILEALAETAEDLSEGVSRRMSKRRMNRKRNKYYTKTRNQLRAGAAKRRKENRVKRPQRKRYYRVNKRKIASYQKSRAQAIKAGRHIKKRRLGDVNRTSIYRSSYRG